MEPGAGHQRAGTEIDANAYFGDTWSVALTFDTLKSAWVEVLPGARVQCTFSADTSLAAANCGSTKTGKAGLPVIAVVTVPKNLSGDHLSFVVVLPSAPIRSITVTIIDAAVAANVTPVITGATNGVVTFTATAGVEQGDTFAVSYTGTQDKTFIADTSTPDTLDDGAQFGRGYWVWYKERGTMVPK